MRINLVETAVGALVLLAAVFFFYFSYKASSTHLKNGYELTAKFDRVDGLNTGNDVKLSGVKVGVVEKITIDPNTFMAIVYLLIEPKIKLPTDTAAEIVSESFMGGKYIALVPGGEDEFLTPGSEIRFTQASISWESLIGKFLFSKEDDKTNRNDTSPSQNTLP